MLEIFDLSRKKTAILQNAFDVAETEELNAVGSLRFSLPDDDPKAEFCSPFHYVRYDGGQLYRILTPKRTKGDVGSITFECEHVIATLIDDVMFGAYTYGNIGLYTTDTINYVLGKQTARNWVLDECDFARQFEYGWENENLLAALFSVPNRFADPYMWVYDTSVYPWKVSLKRINEEEKPEYYVRATKNLIMAEEEDTSAEVCTRLYCLGYGEGVNQLRISSVNNGVPYLQSPPEYVAKYGIISRIWTDRRFEDAESLKARGQALLSEYQEPRLSRSISAADLSEITNDPLDHAAVGKIAMLVDDNTKTYITRVVRHLDADGVSEVTIANKPVDIARSMADLADRQRIEQVYAQGATNLYGQSVQANASPTKGAIIKFFIPEEMRIVNAIKAKIALDAFRSYSRATRGGGASQQTSSAGGGSTQSSSSGGGSTQTTSTEAERSTSSSSGGGHVATTDMTEGVTSKPQNNWGDYADRIDSTSGGMVNSSGSAVEVYTTYVDATGSHRHRVLNHAHAYCAMPMHRHGLAEHKHAMVHQHSFTLSSHRHTVTIPAHAHTVSIPAHTHNVNIPSHTHNVTIPDHVHEIEQGIFEFGSPTGASVWVNGTRRGDIGTSGEINLTEMLLDDNGSIPRGSWHEVEVRPNDLAYIAIDLFVQGFVQSRGGSTY